jgi:hypothetical protein
MWCTRAKKEAGRLHGSMLITILLGMKLVCYVESEFNNKRVQALDRTVSKAMLAFIRIPKTGSSSLLKWVPRAGRIPHLNAYLAQWRKRILWYNGVVTPFPFSNQQNEQVPYSPTRTRFKRLQLSEIHSNGYCCTFTMPKISLYPGWSFLSIPEQNTNIQTGHISGWMELLHEQGGGKVFHLLYQKNVSRTRMKVCPKRSHWLRERHRESVHSCESALKHIFGWWLKGTLCTFQ